VAPFHLPLTGSRFEPRFISPAELAIEIEIAPTVGQIDREISPVDDDRGPPMPLAQTIVENLTETADSCYLLKCTACIVE
jgi:hypothetical protein